MSIQAQVETEDFLVDADAGLVVYLCDASANNIVVALPPAENLDSFHFYVKRTDRNVNNAIKIVATDGETIDSESILMIGINRVAHLIANGGNWWNLS